MMGSFVNLLCPGALLSKQERKDTPTKARRARRSRSVAIVMHKEAVSNENGKPQIIYDLTVVARSLGQNYVIRLASKHLTPFIYRYLSRLQVIFACQ